MLLPPAFVQFRAVHLFSWRPGVARGDDGIKFVNDDSPEIPPETGALVGAPGGKVEEIGMPVGPHQGKNMERPVLKHGGLHLCLPLFLSHGETPLAEDPGRMGVRRCENTFYLDIRINYLRKSGKFSPVHLAADIFTEAPS